MGAIAQVAAAIGLIPSLIYLAIQVREQNRVNRRASLDLHSTQQIELIRTINESPDFSSIYLRGLKDFESLDPASRLRFGAYLMRVFRYWDGIYFHYADGAMPPQFWQSVRRQIQDVVAYPGVQAWWASRKHWYTEEFNALIDGVIDNAPTPNAYSTYEPPIAPSAR
jgi:hypothetical protein